jgi:hypothetical protein
MGSETFELERFVWASPDRLEIDGRFVGLGELPPGAPVLVLHGTERTHRLPAAADVAFDDGELWHAAFTWQEAPTAFGAVELELGGELLVELPEPGSDAEASELGVLAVRRRGGAERLRLQADLFAVRSELGEARASLERAEKELARARDDLAQERADRATDAERFRADLAQAQGAAQATVEETLAELEALQTRVVELGRVGEEADRLRAQLTAIRELLDDAGDRSDAGGERASR